MRLKTRSLLRLNHQFVSSLRSQLTKTALRPRSMVSIQYGDFMRKNLLKFLFREALTDPASLRLISEREVLGLVGILNIQ